MTSENIVFLFVLVAALGFFSYNAERLVRYLRVAHDENRGDDPWTRLRNVAVIGIGQSKILRDPLAGILHASVFWGFVVLTVGTVEILIRGVFPAFGFDKLLPDSLYGLFLLSQELFAGLVLGAVGVLLYRRLVVKPKRLQGDKVHSGDAVFILSMIGALMITLLVTAAFERVIDPDHPLADATAIGDTRRRIRWRVSGNRRRRRACQLVVARAADPRVPQLPAVLEAPARHHVAPQHVLLEHERTGADRRDAANGPGGRGRRAVRRGGRAATSRGRTCSTATRAPNAVAARPRARRTSRARC